MHIPHQSQAAPAERPLAADELTPSFVATFTIGVDGELRWSRGAHRLLRLAEGTALPSRLGFLARHVAPADQVAVCAAMAAQQHQPGQASLHFDQPALRAGDEPWPMLMIFNAVQAHGQPAHAMGALMRDTVEQPQRQTDRGRPQLGPVSLEEYRRHTAREAGDDGRASSSDGRADTPPAARVRPVPLVAVQGGLALAEEQRLHVLCIEDNPVNLMLVEELLAWRPRTRFLGAADAATGLRLAAEHQPQVLLLDLTLPDLDGQALLRQLRGLPRLISSHFVALVAADSGAERSQFLSAGFQDVWTKPLNVAAFLAGVDALCQRFDVPVERD